MVKSGAPSSRAIFRTFQSPGSDSTVRNPTSLMSRSALRLPASRPGSSLNRLRETDTCAITFNGCFVPTTRAFQSVDGARRDTVANFQRAWFQTLASAAYLGALERALEEAAKIAATVTTKTGRKLADFHTFRLDIARLHLAIKNSETCFVTARARQLRLLIPKIHNVCTR
jgi:alkylation response protein AidB-like acyl-CoA dehydrogenase